MIGETMRDDQILLRQAARSWEDAIRLAARPLLAARYIEARYIDAMIDAVAKYGPYIVVAKGVALAHARPEDGVNRLGLSVITLENPVAFGHESNDPVRVVFCLAAVDDKAHLAIMKSLVRIIDEEWKIREMARQKSLRAFKSVLEALLKA